jgi:NAD-dependent dihydropyrimidine dehydrogenase PreA subunit
MAHSSPQTRNTSPAPRAIKGPYSQGTSAGKRSSDVTYVITEGCIDLLDKTCIDECPVDCIYEGGRMVYIQPDECGLRCL